MALLFVIIIIVVITIMVSKKLKRLNLDNVILINGGVGSGKTSLCVALALRTYKKQLFKVSFINLFRKKGKKLEKPLLYSNIPLKTKYVPFTLDLLLRKERFNYKSVVLLSECSLIANSQDYSNQDINTQMTLFIKLFRHETKGGYLFIETQNINDNHYSIKRGLSRYIWIYSMLKYLPFVNVYKVREMLYNDSDNSINNVFENDVDENTKLVITSKNIFKMYDTYTYSLLTDELSQNNNVVNNENAKQLKSDNIVSLHKEYKGGQTKNDKQKN